MESDSNKWFRDKWNRLDKMKQIEDSWFDVFNDKVEDEMLRRYNSIEKKYYGRKNRKGK